MGSGFGGDVAPRDGMTDGSLTVEQAMEWPEDDPLIVSIGDSVASGEGNPDRRGRFGEQPVWHSPRCHRSLISGHGRAALAIERDDPDTDVGFVALACSGATVWEGLLGEYRGQAAQVTRVNELAKRRVPDAVLLSVGANDSLFAPLVSFCLARRNCETRRFGDHLTLAAAVEERLASLPGRYAAVDDALAKEIERDRVLIVEYFDPTRADGEFCRMSIGELGVVDEDESEWMYEDVLTPLNEAVRAAAKRHGWRLVEGVDKRFEGHGICARPASESWVVSFEQSIFRLNFSHKGTLHPDHQGHAETAKLIHPELAEVLGVEPREQDDPPAAGTDDPLDARDVAILAAIAIAILAAGLFGWRRWKRPPSPDR